MQPVLNDLNYISGWKRRFSFLKKSLVLVHSCISGHMCKNVNASPLSELNLPLQHPSRPTRAVWYVSISASHVTEELCVLFLHLRACVSFKSCKQNRSQNPIICENLFRSTNSLQLPIAVYSPCLASSPRVRSSALPVPPPPPSSPSSLLTGQSAPSAVLFAISAAASFKSCAAWASDGSL